MLRRIYRLPKLPNHLEKYPFELSNFQKWAIKGITENKSVLITAHTGSGKTLPAEYAIEYYVSQGKKVIYTCPIKALSNDKIKSLESKYRYFIRNFNWRR